MRSSRDVVENHFSCLPLHGERRWLSRRWVSFLVALAGLSGSLANAAEGDTAGHWSFQKPVRPAVPERATLKYGDRVRNPIDAFVLKRLAERGLSPAPMPS